MTPSKTFLSPLAPLFPTILWESRSLSNSLAPAWPAVLDTRPLVWGSIRPVQTQCKGAPNSRGSKTGFPRITLKPSLGWGCRGAKPLPPLQLHWQDGSNSESLLIGSCSISTPSTCFHSFCFDLVSSQFAKLSYELSQFYFPVECLGFLRNFIVSANNDNVLSSLPILLFFYLLVDFFQVDQDLHYCVNNQCFWQVPNLKGTSMQSFCTQGPLHGLYMTSAVTQDPRLGLILCCCPLEIQIIFEQEGPHFHFVLGTANYITDPVWRTVGDVCVMKPAIVKSKYSANSIQRPCLIWLEKCPFVDTPELYFCSSC